MTEALINHLWQSTLFAFAAAVFTLAFRNNSANIRFLIWLAASAKFLIPFPLFIFAGKHFHWAPTVHASPELSLVIDQIAQPGAMMASGFAAPSLPDGLMHWGAWTIVLAIWSTVSAALICRWLLQWTRFRAVVRTSSPLYIVAPIPVRQTATVLEPGLFGIFQPVLLLPEGIVTHLAPEQLNTVIDHELCHWRRRDNLTAAIHMMVETIFWFHPLVWWLGGRMMVERERACDEAVVQSGSDRQVYAEGILKVCQLYVGPPPACVAGVSGGTLRERIEQIMTNQMVKLSLAKKCLMAIMGFAAIVGPFAVGFSSGPPTIAQAQNSEMRHYKSSSEWHFELDIPKRWNSFPAVPTNSPNEVIRFASHEDGNHLLIVFRNPYDPQESPEAYSGRIQKVLEKNGFSHFVSGETTIGSRRVVTLDFDRTRPDGSTWSCRHYFIIDGTLSYTLGFGTTQRDAMFDLFDRMAKSFVFEESPG
jgi:beta-lactamase regulating signal transducer with metallopeptidase domain